MHNEAKHSAHCASHQVLDEREPRPFTFARVLLRTQKSLFGWMMPTSFFQSLFQTRLGRRTLGLFVFGALSPLSVLSWVFYHQTSELLLAQTSSHLRQESTSRGMMLYNHLLTLTAALDRMAADLPQDGPVVETSMPPAPGTELDRQFQGIRILTLEPGQRELTPHQIAHLQEGKSLLEIHHVSGHQPQLTLTRLINPHRLEAGLLVAQLDGTTLWGGRVRETLPADTDLVVEDGAGQPIYSTFEPALALPDFRGEDGEAPVETGPLWTIGGQDYVAGAWSIPLRPLFLMDSWVMVVSQTRKSALSPLTQVRHTLLLVMALTSCIVMLLSFSLIRRNLHPLHRLREGIVRLASGNFSTQVTVHNHDEFEELADSFNGMTDSLSRRFRMEESISSIGQALLSIHEPTALANVVLPRIAATVGCDATGLVSLDSAHSDSSVLSMQFRGGQSDELTVSHCHVTDEHRETLGAQPDHTLVTSASLPSFLSAMRRPDLSLFALVPIIVTDMISGVLVLGYRQKKRPPTDSLGYARRVADLLALAVLNSRAMKTHAQAQLDVTHSGDGTQVSAEGTILLPPPSPSPDTQDGRVHLQQPALLSLVQDQRVCTDSLPVSPQPTGLDTTGATAGFLTAMSHDIRTPLSGVIGMTEVLAHTPLTDAQRQYVDTIHNSAATMLMLISNHLTCSEIETGTLEVHPVPIDLRDLVETTVEQLAESAQRKGIQIHTVYDPSVPTAVMSDPLRIGQILTNLLSNAIRFTQTGEVTVSVTQRPDGTGRQDIPRIKLAVADTGSGISLERQADLFRSCSRADRSSTRVPGRAGLGLPLCKQLTELMGGVIGVESAIGTGSTFSVILPFPLQSDTPVPVHTEPAFANLCLCAAVSSSTVRRLLTQYLSSWGVSPYIADTEGEFLECVMTGLATERGPVVAVIDETFDHMTAAEIVRTLFSEPTLRIVKIIRLVSLIRKADAANDIPSAHIQDVTKPIRFQALHHALCTVLTIQPSIEKHAGSALASKTFSGHILLGEDDGVNQEIALLMLQNMGYRVTVAHNGREVVDHAKQSAYDVILMDCHMPELDGFEATREIREWEQHESRPPIPIIALTAHATPDDRERCLAVGMSDYISKPFTMAHLQATLTFWFSLNPMTENHESAASNQSGLMASIPTASPPIRDSDSSLVVDQNAWKSITRLQRPGQPDALATILSLYLADSHNLVTTLHHGMANGNSQVVHHAAHSLRSRSATLGAVSLSKLCRQFEELSRQGHIKDAEPLLAPLTAAFEHASRIFQAELERRPT